MISIINLTKDNLFLNLLSFMQHRLRPIETKIRKPKIEATTIKNIGTNSEKFPAEFSAENAYYLVIGLFSRSSH